MDKFIRQGIDLFIVYQPIYMVLGRGHADLESTCFGFFLKGIQIVTGSEYDPS